MNLFEFEAVSLRRGGREVLRELSLVLPTGIGCLFGPSGSGKSSCLRLMNRLSDPTAGRVLYGGAPVEDRDVLELRREVCLVPQLPVPLAATVAANLRWAAGFAGLEADIDRLLELAGLEQGFAERDATRLSIGEQQRVMIARALALQPKVLLLDEPTSALDSRSRDAVESTLGSVREEIGVSIVLVTHDLSQAERLADAIIPIEAPI